MDRSGASAFVYAKASGMLANSYIGSRAVKLFSVKSLAELWELVFKTEVPGIPETLLARKIEQTAQQKFIDDYIRLLDSYDNPDEILISLLRFYDYDNLKEIGAALCYHESEEPFIADIHQYSMLQYKAWPDLKKITAGSPVSWYNKAPESHEQQTADARLDIQYVQQLWQSAQKLSSDIRSPVLFLLQRELSVQNILWALRLRVYYHMKPEEIPNHLAYADNAHSPRDILAADAHAILSKAVDSWDDWKGWKYAAYLNPHEEGVVWQIDPRWIERLAKIKLNERALHEFHRFPLSTMVLFAWFKIKQNELDSIRTAAEGLRLNVESSQIMDFAGIRTTGRGV